MVEELKVRCKVRPGLFKSEYIVTFPVVSSGSRRQIEFVSDADGVMVTAGAAAPPCDASVRVWKVGESNDSYVVLIPASGGSDAMKVSVPAECVLSA